MATILPTTSRSLKEYRLIPGYTEAPMNEVDLRTRFCRDGDGFLELHAPLVSAAMQAVTGAQLAIALAQTGGIGVLPVSRPIDEICSEVRKVKQFRAGFQTDIVTFAPNQPIGKVLETIEATGFRKFPVTDNGMFHGRLLGVITDKDFDPRYDCDLAVAKRMRTDLQTGVDVTDLREANELMIRYGRGFLPVVSREGTLQSVVFRKDLDKHIQHPHATVDREKRLRVAAAISTHPEDRARAEELIRHNVDAIVIDASDGFTRFQVETLDWLKHHSDVPVIAGNVVNAAGSRKLVEHGADAVKIGIGIGSGCITQEVKATGRGQATAIIDVANARDAYAQDTGQYIPLIADGSVTSSGELAVALALGADTVMMGNFFARFTESPAPLVETDDGRVLKEYWMEGTRRAFNNRRYAQQRKSFFEEGICGHVPHAGSLYEHLPVLLQKLKSTLSTVGATRLEQFRHTAELEPLSPSAQQDSSIHAMTVIRQQ